MPDVFSSPFQDSPYYPYALQAAQQRGINPQFFVTQIGQESSFQANPITADSLANDVVGIAQFKFKTAQQYGVMDRTDPIASLYGAAKFDADLLAQCGGDYVCVAQRYGTLPKSGDLSSGQQSVLQAAQQANAENPYTQTYADKWTCIFTPNDPQCQRGQRDFTASLGAAGLGPDAKCDTLDLSCNLAKFGADALAIVSGLILVTVGLVMLKTGDDLPGIARRTATGTVKLAKKTVTMPAAEAAALAVL